MPYEPTRGGDRFIDDELDVPHQSAGHRAKQPLPKRDIIAAAQAERQARIEAQARQRNFQGTARIPANASPNVRQRPAPEDEELYENDDLYTRPPRSAIKYQPEEIYNEGDTSFYAGQVVIPKKRRSAQPQLTAGRTRQPQEELYRDDPDEQVQERPRRHRPKIRVNPLVWLGLGMIVMIVLWLGFSNLVNWWNIHSDDSTYGRPRTFQIDAVVGHDDSKTNPSHFIAINLNRHVIVIELPGGDPTKARIYPATTLFGDGQELTPVTLTFKDVTGSGLLDMEIHIQDQTIVMVNANGQFVPLKPGQKVHL
jgi:hypothetical protein